mgnify:CR=1 FL=1
MSYEAQNNPLDELLKKNAAKKDGDFPPKIGEDGQSHVHEFLGSTRIAEEKSDAHNHRFAGVTSEVIPLSGGNHKHGFFVNTDFYEDHLHELSGVTGPAIFVDCNRHVHFAKVLTTVDDDHFHEAIFATLIEDPIGELK